MKPLKCLQTDYTPGVDFDASTRTLQMSGISRPENAVEFYAPILDWLDEFLEREAAQGPSAPVVHLTVDLDYFNSVSAKYLVGILVKLKEALAENNRLEVKWLYNFGDEENREWGEDIAQIVAIPFTITEKDL